MENTGSSAGPRVHSSDKSPRYVFESSTVTRVFGLAVPPTSDCKRSRNLFEYAAGTLDCSPRVRGEVLYIKGLHEDEYVSLQALMFRR